MAKLEDLYEDFMALSEEEQTLFIRKYREKRAKDLLEITTYTIRKNTTKLSDEEKALLKSLGIKAGDLTALRGLIGGDQDDEDEEEDSDVPRFTDD
jgi:hypothetical protein